MAGTLTWRNPAVWRLWLAGDRLWLAGDPAPEAGRPVGLDLRRRAPLGDLDHARLEQVEAVEEAGHHLAGTAHVVALGQVLDGFIRP